MHGKLFHICSVASLEKDECPHPGCIGGLCIRCGKKMDDESGVAFGYIHKVAILKFCTSCYLFYTPMFHGCGVYPKSCLAFYLNV